MVDNKRYWKIKKISILRKYVYGNVIGKINTDKYIKGRCILRENNPTYYYCIKCNYNYSKNLIINISN